MTLDKRTTPSSMSDDGDDPRSQEEIAWLAESFGLSVERFLAEERERGANIAAVRAAVANGLVPRDNEVSIYESTRPEALALHLLLTGDSEVLRGCFGHRLSHADDDALLAMQRMALTLATALIENPTEELFTALKSMAVRLSDGFHDADLLVACFEIADHFLSRLTSCEMSTCSHRPCHEFTCEDAAMLIGELALRDPCFHRLEPAFVVEVLKRTAEANAATKRTKATGHAVLATLAGKVGAFGTSSERDAYAKIKNARDAAQARLRNAPRV